MKYFKLVAVTNPNFFSKVKVKFPLYVLESGGVAPRILDLGTRCR
jgi:hypothetical protein